MTYGGPIPGEGNPAQKSQWPTMPTQAQGAQPGGGFGPPQAMQQSVPQAMPQPLPQAVLPQVQRTPEPDWSALADKHERDTKRGKWKLIGAVTGAFVLGAVAGGVGVKAMDGGKGGTPVAGPSASGTAAPSGSASPSPAGLQLADANGTTQLTVSPEGTVKPGNGSKVLWLTGGSNSFAETGAQVLDTTQSFTVSAWVLNQAPTLGRAVISQGTGAYFSFSLGRDYWPKHDKWVFKVQTQPGAQAKTTAGVYSKADATIGKWVYLTGSYDAKAHTIALYVDGQLAGKQQISGIWTTDGALEVGRDRYQNAWGDQWNGAIAHVQVWDTALTPAQVASAAHNKPGVPATAHSWLVN